MAEPSPEDRDLVLRAQAGDRGALGELLGRHRQRAFRVSARILGNREDALDATQEAMLRACKYLGGVRPERPFGAWLSAVAVRAALDLARRRAARTAVALEPERVAGAGADPAELAARGDLTRTIGAALDRLSPAQRAAFVCKELEGMDTAETARAMGCLRSTVRWHLFEAKKHLARGLGHLREERP
ncbi:MAG TPA: sigma-70 family RNA polymerase sigma factor [Myxococcota bacterium]|nr:sigma-70 family RNA polymerase sigma factor [Myxococcota bacterium]HRY97067.1 sigma-70 family RNA polymerase sigma factor [Myxococcota bacterium]HSA21452.1 sigma-70 family RNA polymerase sigma factor [Myxococcota bacterium]